jgi:leucyl aminopeptidase
MVNERAMVPGDILTASNGKTIEVMNTDAEGRLTMADALVVRFRDILFMPMCGPQTHPFVCNASILLQYADKHCNCECIVELSTLTGSCMVALGNRMAGLWSKDDAIADALLEASKSTGEKIWRMPLEEEYKEGLKSKVRCFRSFAG